MRVQLSAALVALFAASAVGQSLDSEFDALRRGGKRAEIETLARERLAQNPADDIALWHLAGVVASDAGKRQDTIGRVERCIKEQPRSARCHSALGNLYSALAASGSMSAGIKYAGRVKEMYLKAVELDPRHFGFRRELNQFYLRAPGLAGGSVSKAIEGSKQYSQTDPARGQVLMAEVQIYEEEFDDAEATLASLRPGSDVDLAEAARDATFGLGLALMEDEQASRARQVFERQIASDPDYANAHFGLGRALLELEKTDAAIASLQRALQLDPAVRAHYRLGIAYENKGDVPQALAMYRRFLGYSPVGRAADDVRKRIDKLSASRK